LQAGTEGATEKKNAEEEERAIFDVVLLPMLPDCADYNY
jgi:hypothetical protein